jgi:isoleucyl-tRNA synthetase
VALELAIDEDLRREGRSREIVHAIQNARKTAGLQVEDRIELALAGHPELIEAAQAHRDYVSGETLATALEVNGAGEGAAFDYSEQTDVEGLELQISLRRVAAG